MFQPTPWQQRVIDECDEVNQRLIKLRAFMTGRAYSAMPCQDRELLIEQMGAMCDYYVLLCKRIQRFKAGA